MAEQLTPRAASNPAGLIAESTTRKTEVASMLDRSIRLNQGLPVSGAPTTGQNMLPQSRTTWTERFLLVTTIILLPLQAHIPSVAGISVMFLIFAALAAYIIVNRPHILGKTWCHPVFIAAYAFIGVSALLEFSSPLSEYQDISRFGHMIGGAVCVAALCRDRSALTACLYGYIVAALWVSVVLYLTSYGTLRGATATDFSEGAQVRARTFADNPVQGDLNGMAIVCAQGAVVAFALSLSSRLKHRRGLMLGIATFCLIGAFLPMSRGGAVVSLLSFAAVLYTHGVRHGKALVLACMLGLCVYVLVPDAVWSRMMFSTEVRHGRMESRVEMYTVALQHFPDYFISGVGAGNYFNKWGYQNGFAIRSYKIGLIVGGTHNSFLQVVINWGLIGLLAFLAVIWQAYRCLPKKIYAKDGLALGILGISVGLALYLLQFHNFYNKDLSLGLGILVGARHWIWPAGIVSAVEVKQRSLSDGNRPYCHSG